MTKIAEDQAARRAAVDRACTRYIAALARIEAPSTEPYIRVVPPPEVTDDVVPGVPVRAFRIPK